MRCSQATRSSLYYHTEKGEFYEVKSQRVPRKFIRARVRWRRHRRAVYDSFGPRRVPQFRQIQARSALEDASDILSSPDQWEMYLDRYATPSVHAFGMASYDLNVLFCRSCRFAGISIVRALYGDGP